MHDPSKAIEKKILWKMRRDLARMIHIHRQRHRTNDQIRDMLYAPNIRR